MYSLSVLKNDITTENLWRKLLKNLKIYEVTKKKKNHHSRIFVQILVGTLVYHRPFRGEAK